MAATLLSPAEAGVKVGDFFVASWGYDQTNIDFYKVVGLTPKGLKVQAWSSALVDSDGYSDRVVPGDGPLLGGRREDYTYDPDLPAPIQTKRLTAGTSRPAFKVASYANAYLWSGEAARKTALGWGH